ncbi:hypothetical protein SOP85_17220 [Pseudomonas sp. YuFO20]|uniref:hypothetical protein n=1 Tax=Pseudomonas sp. YuFO20 TaxID=3095362 RepID=UPI002B255262|nr:hypothetical protein [Pseudomonas sp. YuFO20]MEB2517170.1 hypothetical protein [Pseudomonas sp. YuFO20]
MFVLREILVSARRLLKRQKGERGARAIRAQTDTAAAGNIVPAYDSAIARLSRLGEIGSVEIKSPPLDFVAEYLIARSRADHFSHDHQIVNLLASLLEAHMNLLAIVIHGVGADVVLTQLLTSADPLAVYEDTKKTINYRGWRQR